MEPQNKKSLHSIPLKIISLLLGFTFWYIFGSSHIGTAWITVPLCFYNVSKQSNIKAPESLSVKITGKRIDLRSLDLQEVAIHIDATQLQEGKNKLTITPETIFLPDSIKLVHYSPSNPIVEITKI